MKSIEIEMPDQMATVADGYVKAGFFRSEGDLIRAAVADFVRRNQADLLDRFAREDIQWALKEARQPA